MIRIPSACASLLLIAIMACDSAAQKATLPRLKVSENKRFLVTADNKPFFYLGDTAWELFHRLNREEAELYLNNRASKRFTVIQAVVLAELDGLKDPNPYGQVPLIDNDPTRPNEKYFEHVDWIVNKAESLGLYIGMLPTWGDKWNKDRWGVGPEIFTPENAERYGRWLGQRYRDRPIIWILGGDRKVVTDKHRAIIRAMARGLRAGDGGNHLCTFHPQGGEGSSQYFHDDDWLDFNMCQNGHQAEFTGRYDRIQADYRRTPIKPVLDGEPIYEGIPISFRGKDQGHSTAADVRRPLYWDLFNGAFGHTYGHNSVWQMVDARRKPMVDAYLPWKDALDAPGSAQMQHGRALIESRPFLTRIPDETILVPERVVDVVPGAGTRRFAATRDTERTYAFVYVPIGQSFQVAMDCIHGESVKAWWFNPRDGKATQIGIFANRGRQRFTPPQPGELLDWVLVLDDAGKNYPPPGQRGK